MRHLNDRPATDGIERIIYRLSFTDVGLDFPGQIVSDSYGVSERAALHPAMYCTAGISLPTVVPMMSAVTPFVGLSRLAEAKFPQ